MPVTTVITVCIVINLLLLILSIVISVAKQELTLLSQDDVKLWEKDKELNLRRIYALMQKSEKLMATIQITNAIAKISFVILATYSIFLMNMSASIRVLTIAMSLIIMILLVEIAPRKYVPKNKMRLLPHLSILLQILNIIFFPLIIILLWSEKRFNKKQNRTIDDLSNVLENTSETPENKVLLKGIVKFGNIEVHTIMTPRIDVESVDLATGLSELMLKTNEWGYSRIPVYDDSPDNIKGILYVKDLLPYIEETDDFNWQSLIRSAYFVPENKKIDDLLIEFQAMKIHVAVIIDEYGSMVGIATLEDILEEIVGDIADESDDDEQDYIKIDERTYLFDGKVLLNDFFRIMQVNEEDFEEVRGEADTLAGIILEMKGEIPQKGDSVNCMQLALSVESVDNKRIKQIKVVVNE